MKRVWYIVVAAALCVGVTSCKNKKAKEPESAKFSWYLVDDYNANLLDLSKANANPDTVELSDQLVFVADADADSYVVWTGQPGSKYEDRELSDELLKDPANHVSEKAQGLALSATDGKGRKYKTYRFSEISPVGQPFEMYATARNYSFESGEFAEVKAGPFPIVVIDSQTELWGEDPQCTSCTDYRMIVKSWDPTQKSGKGKMVNGTFEVIYPGSSITANDGTVVEGPGVLMHFDENCKPDSCQFVFKANNCIPIYDASDKTWRYNTAGAVPLYYWTLDFSDKSVKVLTIKSQSAAADAKQGDKYTADYNIYADFKVAATPVPEPETPETPETPEDPQAPEEGEQQD